MERTSLLVLILFQEVIIDIVIYIDIYIDINIQRKKTGTKFILEVVMEGGAIMRILFSSFLFICLVCKIYIIYNSTIINYFLFKIKIMLLINLKDYLKC